MSPTCGTRLWTPWTQGFPRENSTYSLRARDWCPDEAHNEAGAQVGLEPAPWPPPHCPTMMWAPMWLGSGEGLWGPGKQSCECQFSLYQWLAVQPWLHVLTTLKLRFLCKDNNNMLDCKGRWAQCLGPKSVSFLPHLPSGSYSARPTTLSWMLFLTRHSPCRDFLK